MVSAATSSEFCVVNESRRVSEVEASAMARAVALQVFEDAEDPWGRQAMVSHARTRAEAKQTAALIVLVDGAPPEPGVLGEHGEEGDRAVSSIYVDVILDNGGSVLGDGAAHASTGLLTVSSVLSHEVLEALVDPTVNIWWQTASGLLVAAEIADPVEDLGYTKDVGGVPVVVSDFVLPTWSDPQATYDDDAPFDVVGALTAPFTRTAGGYWVQMEAGVVSSVFGDARPSWRTRVGGRPGSRASRRSR